MAVWTEEDHKNFARQFNLYDSLSEEDKCFIVSQWDQENGLKSCMERLYEKETKPERDKKRFTLIAVGVIGLLVLGFFIGEPWGREKGGYKGYTQCRDNLNLAMEEYSPGLRKKVLDDLKSVEEEQDFLSYEARH